MKDPYEILGIPRTASDDEVKTAYRELAKKYHPDKYAEPHIAALAEEKMKEINGAYDQIQRERAGYAGAGGGSFDLSRIRALISQGNVAQARMLLNSVPMSRRTAEWFYLSGLCQLRRGAYYDAQRSFDQACRMDPGNAEYAEALNSIRNNSNEFYRNSYNGANSASDCGPCDICAGFMCADCLCRGLCGSRLCC